MLIRMKTTSAGPSGVFPAGSVLEVPYAEARALLDGGFAELAASPRKAPESAVIRAPENAMRRNPAPRLGRGSPPADPEGIAAVEQAADRRAVPQAGEVFTPAPEGSPSENLQDDLEPIS